MNEIPRIEMNVVPEYLGNLIKNEKDNQEQQRNGLIYRIIASKDKIWKKYYPDDDEEARGLLMEKRADIPFKIGDDGVNLVLEETMESATKGEVAIKLNVNPEKHKDPSKLICKIMLSAVRTTLLDSRGNSLDSLDDLKNFAEIMEFANTMAQDVKEIC